MRNDKKKDFAVRLALTGAAALLAPIMPAAAQTAGFDRQITFGDSLSDGGAYAAFVPPGAGSFTTNPDPVWVEVLAGGLGLTLDPASQGGLNFAEGGARVATPQPPGLFTQTNIAAQIDGYLAGGGTFSATDIVTLQGGGNDIFALQRGDATLADIDQAGRDLAALAQRVVDAGAGTLVLANVQTLDLFNQPFEAALAEQGTNALFLDVDGLYGEIAADPAAFGFTNLTDPACTTSSSLSCLPGDYVTADANETYLLADSVHPAGRAQAIQGNMALAAVLAPAQIGQLAYVGEAELLRTASAAETLASAEGAPGLLRLIGGVSYGSFEIAGDQQRVGLEDDSWTFRAGIEAEKEAVLGFTSLGTGLFVSYGLGDGSFGQGRGGYDSESLTGTLYMRGKLGGLRLRGQATYGEMQFDEVTRAVALTDDLTRFEMGDTQAELFGGSAEAAFALVDLAISVSPLVGISYVDVQMDGYAEESGTATAIAFSDTDFSATRGYAGIEARGGLLGVEPYLRVAYFENLGDDDERLITVTPEGAPVSFTTGAYTADDSYVGFEGGVSFEPVGGIGLAFGVSGQAEREDIDRLSATARLSFTF
ncbi:autotransporter domain-containing protein [Parvularcula oceani]|uniref:autotransporter domain-containing protein n=1 Tax=Parvularcula oceani TaxID=1247963 RepID=UPI0004E1221B|nr:autotransporter domain-containing protein [Parvularcula oceani]